MQSSLFFFNHFMILLLGGLQAGLNSDDKKTHMWRAFLYKYDKKVVCVGGFVIQKSLSTSYHFEHAHTPYSKLFRWDFSAKENWYLPWISIEINFDIPSLAKNPRWKLFQIAGMSSSNHDSHQLEKKIQMIAVFTVFRIRRLISRTMRCEFSVAFFKVKTHHDFDLGLDFLSSLGNRPCISQGRQRIWGLHDVHENREAV